MIQPAIAAFVGCFSALLVLAEIQAGNKLLRYLAAFVVGILVTLGLAWLLGLIVAAFARVHGA